MDSNLHARVKCTFLRVGFLEHMPTLSLSNPMLPSSGFPWLLGACLFLEGWRVGECVGEEEQSGEPWEERGGRAEDRNSSRLTSWEGTLLPPPPFPD